MPNPTFPYRTPYGQFAEDGASFIISRPDTPRPWVNIMSSGTYGVAMSQTGSGYSWLNHATLNRITRWNQDLIQDVMGRTIYMRDDKSGKFWSVGWQPVQAKPESYEVIHGVGYTIITSQNEGIQAQWLVFVPEGEPLEVWRLRIKNTSKTPRSLSLWTYLEWNLGESPDWHREFHRTFIETAFQDDKKIVLAKKRMSPLKNSKGQLWNRTWDHVAWHAVNLPTRDASGDKQAFLGNYGTLQAPAALREGRYTGPTTHKWDDGIASLCVPVELKAGEERSVLFTVGAADSQSQALVKARRYMDFSEVDNAWGRTEMFWDKYIGAFPVETPDKGFDLLTNTWLKYQALSGRLWGRTAYYQMGGAYGFRDQLQDSQVFLPLDPEGTRKQIHLHAAHQFGDGTVYHWWHPLSEEGHPSRFSDDLLWLPFVLMNYLKETGQWSVLAEKAPFAAKPGTKTTETGTLHDHAVRAIEKALTRLSPRGLPLLGEADWNDGLSAAGAGGKGESVWMAHFLYGILRDWADATDRAVALKVLPAKEKSRAARYRKSAEKLKTAVNKHGWDGEWYLGATTDDGSPLGSKKNKEGRIFLNCQTWAVLSGTVDSEARKKTVLKSLEKYLYGPHGPLLLTPAYTVPDEKVGYLTRYSPTTRENGGIYFHAAVWALQMECALGRAHKAWELYQKMSPVLRGAADADLYRCEPYVTPGNVDGPGSPTPGRGGWTWYTGSAAWLYRISTEWILGIRPTWDGLMVRPCLPPPWNEARATRRFRGVNYQISIKRDPSLSAGSQKIVVDGRPLAGDVLPLSSAKTVDVRVSVGPAR
ncbi:MAG: glycosyl transferase family 36 [Elusimicrobia bacterium]|nr:glycosyl transferase family 36 [Elusimicrobiota bacterium]